MLYRRQQARRVQTFADLDMEYPINTGCGARLLLETTIGPSWLSNRFVCTSCGRCVAAAAKVWRTLAARVSTRTPSYICTIYRPNTSCLLHIFATCRELYKLHKKNKWKYRKPGRRWLPSVQKTYDQRGFPFLALFKFLRPAPVIGPLSPSTSLN